MEIDAIVAKSDLMIGLSAITASNRGQGAGPLSGFRVENPWNKR